MKQLEFIVNELLDGNIDLETAIELIEMEFECVIVIGKCERRVFGYIKYPKAMFLTNEFQAHAHHVDMRKLSQDSIIELCQSDYVAL